MWDSTSKETQQGAIMKSVLKRDENTENWINIHFIGKSSKALCNNNFSVKVNLKSWLFHSLLNPSVWDVMSEHGSILQLQHFTAHYCDAEAKWENIQNTSGEIQTLYYHSAGHLTFLPCS